MHVTFRKVPKFRWPQLAFVQNWQLLGPRLGVSLTGSWFSLVDQYLVTVVISYSSNWVTHFLSSAFNWLLLVKVGQTTLCLAETALKIRR